MEELRGVPCVFCGELIRIPDQPAVCEECSGIKRKLMPGAPSRSWKDDEDFGSYQTVARRALEDCRGY